jgi:glycosyltransferase involved in cell wall biosynthesis
MKRSVSIIICSRNGARLLPDTLAHLKRQKVLPDMTWEVVLIDNGSTDGTAEVARRDWDNGGPVPLRIVDEERPGAAFARQRGLDEARYEAASFVDDDNWVCADWVERAANAMLQRPETGACGAFSEPAFENKPPYWFEDYKNYYAIGPSNPIGGNVSEPEVLWTAGMTLRTAAWRALRDKGFEFATRRTQHAIGGGAGPEDLELCYALRLAGWRLSLEHGLKFKHFIPSNRLTWGYFRRLQRARSEMAVALDPYYFALRRTSPVRLTLQETWSYQVLNAARCLAQNLALRPAKVLRSGSPSFEGDEDVFRIECYVGRLIGLLRNRASYRLNNRLVRNAAWNQASAMHRSSTSMPGADPAQVKEASQAGRCATLSDSGS